MVVMSGGSPSFLRRREQGGHRVGPAGRDRDPGVASGHVERAAGVQGVGAADLGDLRRVDVPNRPGGGQRVACRQRRAHRPHQVAGRDVGRVRRDRDRAFGLGKPDHHRVVADVATATRGGEEALAVGRGVDGHPPRCLLRAVAVVEPGPDDGVDRLGRHDPAGAQRVGPRRQVGHRHRQVAVAGERPVRPGGVAHLVGRPVVEVADGAGTGSRRRAVPVAPRRCDRRVGAGPPTPGGRGTPAPTPPRRSGRAACSRRWSRGSPFRGRRPSRAGPRRRRPRRGPAARGPDRATRSGRWCAVAAAPRWRRRPRHRGRGRSRRPRR